MSDKEALATPSRANADFDAVIERTAEVWPEKPGGEGRDWIAREVPVALVYNGISHAVMMASPRDLEAFAVGFSLSEGIVPRLTDIYGIDVEGTIDIEGTIEKGIQISLDISTESFTNLKERRRNLSGRTGCGICGLESLQQVRVPPQALTSELRIRHVVVEKASRHLQDHQPLQSCSGGMHGAAWCSVEGDICSLCEDVGRHNALDKLIGKLAKQGTLIDKQELKGFLLISSRASYEIVLKAAMAGMAVVVALSAPTSLAIDIASSAGITLVGFSRENRHVVYTNRQRLVE